MKLGYVQSAIVALNGLWPRRFEYTKSDLNQHAIYDNEASVIMIERWEVAEMATALLAVTRAAIQTVLDWEIDKE
jgi:hypothetical protein